MLLSGELADELDVNLSGVIEYFKLWPSLSGFAA